jgi:integrase
VSHLIAQEFQPMVINADVPRIRFHDLRHIAATLLLSRGVNVKVVSEMLGHADVTITLRIYAHVLPHMQQTATDAMDDLFGG